MKSKFSHSINVYKDLIKKAKEDYGLGKFRSREAYLAYLSKLHKELARYEQASQTYNNIRSRTIKNG